MKKLLPERPKSYYTIFSDIFLTHLLTYAETEM